MDGIELFDARELEHRLAEQTRLNVNLALCKAETRFVEGPIFAHDLIPVAVLTAKRVLNAFGECRGSRAASLEIFVALEADPRGHIVRIQFQGSLEVSCGFLEVTHSL